MSFRNVRAVFAVLLALVVPAAVGRAQSSSLRITSFQPAESSFLGRTPYEVRGEGFTQDTRILIDGLVLTPTLVDATRLTGILPAHVATATPLEVSVQNRTGSPASLPRAVSFIGPFQLVSVAPGELVAGDNGEIVLTGVGLTPQTAVTVGGESVTQKVFVNARTIRCTAPPLAEGKYNVRAEEVATLGPPIAWTLEGALRYRPREVAVLPPPQEVEATLAEGTARFSWSNPLEYSSIRVFDRSGGLVATLPGDATSLELPVGSGVSRRDILLQGNLEADLSPRVDAVALALNCDRPPALGGAPNPGEILFHLYGGHPEANVPPCQEGGGGGGGEPSPVPAAAGGGGRLVERGSIGWAGQAIDLALLLPEERNRVLTGFTLERDSDVLELSAFYEKLNHDFGLELRARLTHVFPNDGFTDEIAFPDVFANTGRAWNTVTYYRSFLDPATGDRKACLDSGGKLRQIPKGEYLLELYAVGGDPGVPYFAIADDPRDNELLIPGAPCPPYPMVRVVDLTGFATLPEVCDLKPTVLWGPGDLFDTLAVTVAAVGEWRDADNSTYRIHPKCYSCNPGQDAEQVPCNQAPYKVYPGVEYIWTIHDKAVPTTISSGSSPEVTFNLPDYGCYKLELEIRDRACGFSKKRFHELALVPNDASCPNQYFSFLYPTPQPGGVYAIAGLNPAPGKGMMENRRPVEFRVLVLPRCFCTGQNPCSAAFLDLEPGENPENHLGDAEDDVQFRFSVKNTLGTFVDLHAPIEVIDLCPAVTGGPKFFLVRVEDLGAIPANPVLSDFFFKNVRIEARTNFVRTLQNGQTVKVPVNDPWHAIGKPFRMCNRPPSLAQSYWSGSFDERDQSYHFVVKSSQNTEESHALGPSAAIPLEVPGVDAGVPSYAENTISSGFTSHFKMTGGLWLPEKGDGTLSGNTLGNRIEGKPVRPDPTISFPESPGAGGGGSLLGGLLKDTIPSYEWCHRETVFKQNFSQELFEAVIYTGLVGPIPVTIKGSVGLGLAFTVETLVRTKVSPWELFEGGKYVDARSYAISRVGISVPASITADVLGGIASIAMRLIPEATFELDPYVEVVNAGAPRADYFLQALFSLYFEIEACIQTVVLGEQCFSPGRVPLIKNKPIFATHGISPDAEACEGLALAGGASEEGSGGGVIDQSSTFTANMPVNVLSPDGKSNLVAYVKEDGGEILHIQVNDDPVTTASLPGTSYYLFNPSASFISNTAALLAWTEPDVALDLVPVTSDQGSPSFLATRNANARRANIGVAPVVLQNGDWRLLDAIPVSDEVADTDGGRRADGMPSIAGDISSGNALVAWVRYEAPDYLVRDGDKVVAVPCAEGQACPAPPGKRFYNVVVPNFRPQMEATAIYARRVGLGGPLEGKVKLSGAGINIEPNLAVTPDGEFACCVWVHDPVHTDLIGSNLGRSLKLSVYTRSTGAWSAPGDVLASPDDFPALLEPRVALKSDGTGLIVFTALDPGASETDTGLGGARFLFGVRVLDLLQGQFGQPFKIHGKCDAREYAFNQTIAVDVPILTFPGGVEVPLPEWVLIYQGMGPVGTRAGSGNVMITVLGQGSNEWTAPLRLTDDDRIHSNLAASLGRGRLSVTQLDGGPAEYLPGGPARTPAYQTMTRDLLPDLAVKSCVVSHQFAAPGARLRVNVAIENRGLASSAQNAAKDSLAALQLLFEDATGQQRLVTGASVPRLSPGASHEVVLEIEMPHEPVELLARLSPGPVDSDGSNDLKRSFLGAPAPGEVACEAFRLRHEGDEDGINSPGVALVWTPTAVYDELQVYRDGRRLVTLPGNVRQFVDTDVAPGDHVYAVRARIGASKSRRTSCSVKVDVPPEGHFRRGDSDGSAKVDISDAVRTLGFLFLGGAQLDCPDAADADDNGALEITDAVRTLGYLFLGNAPPPAPGPETCGADPTADALGPCQGGGCSP